MIRLLWPNGEITSGETFDDVEIAVRLAQWTTYESRQEFRDELAARALTWSGGIINTRSTAEKFIRALHGAEMCFLLESDSERSDE